MTSAAELLANGMVTISILLAGRNNIHTWWTGIVGCLIFAAVFHAARLYADVTLQGFFVAASLIGWRQWLRGDRGHALRVSRGGWRLLGLAAGVGTVAAIAYGALLHRFTDAYAPFLDSAILAFSVLAQIFLMQRRIETWPFWLAVNSLAVPLYASRGLYLTAGLYVIYWINALVAWRWWRKLACRPEAA
ncbi:MAG: nicotinamide riboside transporter PnuC [Azonexus sp.]|jgi:nicotinamide mononucleotide transporter|uniref:nicotinamide riboside transporter PnuC n=1 Tax=Azonexus sp. TaxID=1872668 RepID=UPI002837B13A|nr:nicotinamide riboside transporter PnuC [Azonexus sp.]MDR0775663.1 nicotinamide riboside transporter PnuC [Azonexus sp.]